MTFRSLANRSLVLALASLTYLMVSSSSPRLFAAVIVDVDDVPWPTQGTGLNMAEVVTATPNTLYTWYEFADPLVGPGLHMTQTVSVTTGFDLNSLYLIYDNENFEVPLNLGLQIWEVSDPLASTIDDPNAGDLLLDESFLAPDEGSDTTMRLYLTSPLTLSASTNYAVRFIDEPGFDFEWKRTGTSAGNAYAGGKAYNNIGEEIEAGLGGRDFSLGLSSQSIPPPLPVILSAQSGNWNDASTWTSAAVPDPNFAYHAVSGHTITGNTASFSGGELVAEAGGTLDVATSEANVPAMKVQAGGTLTSSAAGDFALGDFTASPLNDLDLDGTANFTPTAGSSMLLDVDLSGGGVLNFQGNGAGSNLRLTATGGFDGTINFNGNGEEAQILDSEGPDDLTLVMNSTGANRVRYNPQVAAGGGDFVFNQPGTIQHAATLAGARLQGPDSLEANAAVAVDLTLIPATNELRFFIPAGLSGTADITVTGTATDPTLFTRTRNEFEVGSTSEPDNLGSDDYSGTITSIDFVDFEIRRSQPNARIVINTNGTLENGHEAIASAHSVAIGEVVINTGGTLEVGYEIDNNRYAYTLTVTDDGTRSGDLTLANGTTTRMQVNGTAAGQFDSIIVEGTATLAGDLEIFVNPSSRVSFTGGTNPVYAPVFGDTFNLIVGGILAADFNGDENVDGLDLPFWEAAYGIDDGGDATGDGDTDGFDFLYWQRQFGQTSAANIVGSFGSLSVNDPGNVMSTAGLQFQLNQSSTLIQLEVVSIPLQAMAAVPEPQSIALIGIATTSFLVRRRRRRGGTVV